MHHDVVVRPERIVIVGVERPRVGLDQALVGRFQVSSNAARIASASVEPACAMPSVSKCMAS